MFMNKGGVSWLVVFLGNPGLKYNGTRHNAGFMAADAMEKKLGVKINRMRFWGIRFLFVEKLIVIKKSHSEIYH